MTTMMRAIEIITCFFYYSKRSKALVMASYIRCGNNHRVSCPADFMIYVHSIIGKTKLKKKDVFEDLLLEAFNLGFRAAKLDVNVIDKP